MDPDAFCYAQTDCCSMPSQLLHLCIWWPTRRTCRCPCSSMFICIRFYVFGVCVCVCHRSKINMDDVCPTMEFCPHCAEFLLKTKQFVIDGKSSEDMVVGMCANLTWVIIMLWFAVTMTKTIDQSMHRETHERYAPTHLSADIWHLCHRLIYAEGEIELWIHKTPTYEIVTERDFSSMCVCMCSLWNIIHILTGLDLTGTVKIFGTMDGQSYTSALLPYLPVRLQHEGTTIRSTVVNNLRQFQFFDLELGKTYTLRVGVAHGGYC